MRLTRESILSPYKTLTDSSESRIIVPKVKRRFVVRVTETLKRPSVEDLGHKTSRTTPSPRESISPGHKVFGTDEVESRRKGPIRTLKPQVDRKIK